MKQTIPFILGAAALSLAGQSAHATCNDVNRATVLSTAQTVYTNNQSGGFHLPMWVTVVDETGKVCFVVSTGNGGNGGASIGNSAWLGSRVISAQKANTANDFSLDGFAISTANLYGLVQPGGSLFGLQESNPIDATRAYSGAPSFYGTVNDPLVNLRIGGVNVFGGGLALYNASKIKVGALGVSGDTSCTDHAFAWQVRASLQLDNVPGGFSTGTGIKGDEMVIASYTNTINQARQVTCAFPPQTGTVTGVILYNPN